MNVRVLRGAIGAGVGCVCVLAGPALGAEEPDVAPAIDVNAALAGAWIQGEGAQAELIVPLPLEGWARDLGGVSQMRVYKGLCGPKGAVATPEQLLDHARRDLERMSNTHQRGTDVTVTYGSSPRFLVTYDSTNGAIPIFLSSLQAAAEYVDGQLDNRVDIMFQFDAREFSGDTIGSAGSAVVTIPWSVYVDGLQTAGLRIPEETEFAGSLPGSTLPVRYGIDATTTNETQVIVNDTQLRAIFGENAVPQRNAISIAFDTTNDWEYFAHVDGVDVASSDDSLMDVAVHEITHGLGFRSSIPAGGALMNTDVAGLDVARFRFNAINAPFGVVGGPPVLQSQFTTYPRHGGHVGLIFDANQYARPVEGGISYIELESGDLNSSGAGFHQPAHLAYKPDFDDKLGIMDPVLVSGETRRPSYWTNADRDPVNDMGWKVVRESDIIGDCDGNGTADFVDIALGARDADADGRLDACELFYDDVSPSGYVSAITQSVYDANGITSLSQFFEGSAMLIDRTRGFSLNLSYTGADTDTVRVFEGFMRVPSPDEYIFRVAHENDVILEIAGQSHFRPGKGELAITHIMGNTHSTLLSLPVPLQLEAGWHAFKMTVLVQDPGQLRLVRESLGLGGWQDVPNTDMGGLFFEDCNGNLRDDQFDPDCDGDGIPDDCDVQLDCDNNGVLDECEPRGDLGIAFDVGVAGSAGELITLGTCASPEGFQFDTEIALWDESGVLIDVNDDDFNCNTVRLSRLERVLPAGVYYLGVTGYNAIFSHDFGVDFATDACSDSGNVFVRLGTGGTVIDDITSGKVVFYRFEVASVGCNGADLAEAFGELNFTDVLAFLTAFGNQDGAADLAEPFGTFNFTDVLEFLTLFGAGCP